jgi:predicted ATPase
VRLFLEGAKRTRGGKELESAEMPYVREICRLLHGVPLALELASSWLPVLSCGEIAEELRRGLDLLSSDSLDLPERHRSMRYAFEHSWRLLDETERRYFARLSIFPGGFRLQAAQRVADISLPMLSALITKSLLHKRSSEHY